MKIKKDFIMKEVAGKYVIVPIGQNLVDFSAMITLNETGAFLWETLQNEKSLDELVDELRKEYDVDLDCAKEDTKEFVQLLKDNNLLDAS